MDGFRLGGWGMYPTLVCGLFLLGVASRHLVNPRPAALRAMVALSVTTLLWGVLGFVTGLIRSLLCLADVPAENRWIWLLGAGEALHCVALALGLVCLAATLAALGALRSAPP